MSTTCFDKELAVEIAEGLLDISAIKLQPSSPFTWASGWKSPIYCDNRISLSYPELRSKIKTAFCAAIKKNFPQVEVIAGVATAGIPQGALIAEELGLPFVYIRAKSKAHGLENMIEGHLEASKKVVVVEDLVSTGGSSLQAVDAIRSIGAEVLGMVSIFTYGFHIAANNLNEKGVKLIYLSDYNTLLDLALKNKEIDEDMLETLNDWRTNPSGWNQ